MSMETASWIPVLYMPIEILKLVEPLWWCGAWAFGVIFEPRYDLDMKRVRKHPVQSLTSIYVYRAFRKVWTIPAGQSDNTRPELLPSDSNGTFLTLDTWFLHLNFPKWTLLSISKMPFKVLLRKDSHHLAMNLWSVLQDSWVWMCSRIPFGISRTRPHRFAALLQARGDPARY